MKLFLLFSAASSLTWALSSISIAEELNLSDQARVLGKISEGRPSVKLPMSQEPLADFRIHWSQVKYVAGQKFTINRIEPPVIPSKEEITEEEKAQQEKEYQEFLKTLKPSGGAFMVFATIYDHKATLVTFSHEGKKYQVWSNLDWNHLGGFATFEGRGKRYDMMLLPTNASSERLKTEIEQGYKITLPTIPPLPDLATKGPYYTVIEGDTKNDEAMEFIEAIHDLYAVEKVRLVTAYEERLKNRQIQALKDAELRKNPPPKPDITINFWERDVVKERQEAAEAQAQAQAKAAELKGEQR